MRTPLVITLFVAICAPLARAQDEGEVVIPLKSDNGSLLGQDCRSFMLPVTVNKVEAEFVWGCSGWTIVSSSFAKKAGLEVTPNKDLDGYLDPDGKPMYLGDTQGDVVVAGKKSHVVMMVMRESKYNRGITGIIGYEIARRFQWEVNPAAPSLTLRPLKTGPAKQPLAILPLKDEGENFSLTVKLRGEEAEVDLMLQSVDIQAGPALQTAWKLDQKPADVKLYPGGRTCMLTGKDALELAPGLTDTNILATLTGDPANPDPTIRNGIGSSILNRFVYCVDADLKQFRIVARIPPKAPATRPKP